MIEKVHFLYTNDLHSHFAHWSRVSTFVKMKRFEYDELGETSWLVDIGDHVDRVHPITEATMGKANVQLMNELKYDYVTLGNNEGITLAHNDLYHLYDDAQFQVLCANLQCAEKENPPWLKSSTITTSQHGLKVGLIGLTVPYNKYYQLLGWYVEPVFETLAKELAFIEREADVIILLSHLGIYTDQQIAETFPQIDVIIGGHTHHLLRNGEIVGNTLLTAAGKHCQYVGEVTLTWDHEAQKLVDKVTEITDVTTLHRDFRTEERLLELTEAAELILSKKIIATNKPLKVNWFKETAIMKHFTEELRKWTNADVAMLNAGLLLDEFPQGTITYRDVHRICPHPINPCVVTLQGAELVKVINESFSRHFMELKLQGFGFRGEVLGRMVFAGIEVMTEVDETGEEYVTGITFAEQPLNEAKTYRVVTADTFTFGRLLPLIAQAEEKELFLPEFLREVLVKALLTYPARVE